MEGSTMMAAVFGGPFQVDIEERPRPTIIDGRDAIVKVSYSGICGSELHAYRGHQIVKGGQIMGHEFTGIIESVGQAVKRFQPGQKVVSAFSPICVDCWFCKHGFTNRCVKAGGGFGNPPLDGGHAEYVRVPFADGTLRIIPGGFKEELAIMMADIFPTGYYGATRAISELLQDYAAPNGMFMKQPLVDSVFVILGCGPVGLCAILTAKMKGVEKLYAVDSVDDRLKQAETFGATPLRLETDDISAVITQATDGRGADAVLEVVGSGPAMRSAFDLLRPCGVLMSLGFHQGDLPFSANEAYRKNLNVHLGRAPVGTVFDEAFEALVSIQDKLETFISHRLPLSEAAKGFALFEKQQARKVVLYR